MVNWSPGRIVLVVVTLLAAGALVGGCGLGVPDDGCTKRDECPAGEAPAGGRPTRIAIDHNEFEAKHIGHTADGRQFFLTTPFDPGTDGADDGGEFVALYLFDRDGRFLEAKIDAFGSREQMDSAAAEAMYDTRLKDLGKVTFDRIEIEPFAVERFGTTFGLIVHEPDEDGTWWVTAEPGDYMAFSEPWDLGEYDT